ncbi:hypothetical protein QQF64_013994 [Cirrhinus molitorella]|uniref:Uncharacterized protein n=1 Tax=Cirrhinus molitorella TaxID=172907 RepID=A0ABR3LWX4_9TELE
MRQQRANAELCVGNKRVEPLLIPQVACFNSTLFERWQKQNLLKLRTVSSSVTDSECKEKTADLQTEPMICSGFLEFVVGAGRFKEDDLNAWRADREICGVGWMDAGLIVQNRQPPSALEVQKLQSQSSKRVESSETGEVNHCNFIFNFGERLEGPSPETEAVLPVESQRKGMRPSE